MIRPHGKRLLVKRLPLPEQTESGLYILGREYPLCGEVLAIGNGVESPQVRVGDMVQFRRKALEAGSHDLLDSREVERDTFILDYENCLVGMRREGDSYKVWCLNDVVMVRQADEISPKL